jgi:hypothetical protein
LDEVSIHKSTADEKAEIVIDELRSAEIQNEPDAFDRAAFAFGKPTAAVQAIAQLREAGAVMGITRGFAIFDCSRAAN